MLQENSIEWFDIIEDVQLFLLLQIIYSIKSRITIFVCIFIIFFFFFLEMKNFLIFTRRNDIRKISMDVDYFADVVVPLGHLKNAVALDIDPIQGK